MSSALARNWVHGIIPDSANREKDDFYPTPARGTEALLSVERFEGNVWEPACGDGSMSKVLLRHGYPVLSTDLIDRGYGTGGVDFLEMNDYTADNIVTNPPFKLAEPFIRHALSRSRRKVAMLCRLAFLEGKARNRMFAETPIARVWVFSRRLSILRGGEAWKGGGGGMIAFAWFVWEHGHEGPPTLGWLP